MRRALAVLVVPALVLSGCGRHKSAAEQAAEDARDIAQVEAINSAKPPPSPVALEPLLADDLVAARRSGAGCVFAVERASQPLVFSGAQRAVMRIDGGPVSMASDPGGAKLPLETWGHYIGKEQSMTLEPLGSAEAPSGTSGVAVPVRLTVRDPNNQVVFTTGGTLACGG